MRKLIFSLFLMAGIGACSDSQPERYSSQALEFQLFKSSEFDYTGTLTVQELIDGELEFTLQLVGPKSEDNLAFPAHLHFGSYDSEDAPIAAMLNSVPISSLRSVTIVDKLSDGTDLNFDQMKLFDGHVKIHLANDGPEYEVILVAGDVGGNFSAEQVFDPNKITVCSPNF